MGFEFCTNSLFSASRNSWRLPTPPVSLRFCTVRALKTSKRYSSTSQIRQSTSAETVSETTKNSSPQKKQMNHVPCADNVHYTLPRNNVQQSNIYTSSRSYCWFTSSTPVIRKRELVWKEQVKWDLTPNWWKRFPAFLVAFNVSDAWERTKFYHLEINTSLNRVFCKKWKLPPEDDREVHIIRPLWSRDAVHNFPCLETRHLFTRPKHITSRLELQCRIRIMLL